MEGKVTHKPERSLTVTHTLYVCDTSEERADLWFLTRTGTCHMIRHQESKFRVQLKSAFYGKEQVNFICYCCWRTSWFFAFSLAQTRRVQGTRLHVGVFPNRRYIKSVRWAKRWQSELPSPSSSELSADRSLSSLNIYSRDVIDREGSSALPPGHAWLVSSAHRSSLLHFLPSLLNSPHEWLLDTQMSPCQVTSFQGKVSVRATVRADLKAAPAHNCWATGILGLHKR